MQIRSQQRNSEAFLKLNPGALRNFSAIFLETSDGGGGAAIFTHQGQNSEYSQLQERRRSQTPRLKINPCVS